MEYCILRADKIKSKEGFVKRVRHDLRIANVANANKFLTKSNNNFGKKYDDIINHFDANYGSGGRFEKRRKDAVLAIDYLIAASPEFFKSINQDEANEYLMDAIKHIENIHGKENVLSVAIHHDETTPHAHIMVLPVDDKGKLNCKHFLGNPAKLRQMQTSFHEIVGKKYGLARGKENSKANHKTISQFYGEINKVKEEVESALDMSKYKFVQYPKSLEAIGQNLEAEANIRNLYKLVITSKHENQRLVEENNRLKEELAYEQERTIEDRRIERLRKSVNGIRRRYGQAEREIVSIERICEECQQNYHRIANHIERVNINRYGIRYAKSGGFKH